MILASTVSAPTRVARKVRVPVVLSVPPTTRSSTRLATGQALAGDHALVHARRAVGHDAVDGDRLAGADADEVADADLGDRARRARRPPRSTRAVRGRQADQAPDRIGGVAPCARLEEAAEQDQRDDRGRGVEVDRQRLAVHAEAGREEERREERSSRRCRSTPPTCRPR